jgi:hypothetical protein
LWREGSRVINFFFSMPSICRSTVLVLTCILAEDDRWTRVR